MQKWLGLEQYKKVYRFIGIRSIRYLTLGVVAGIALSLIEVTFAYLLQAFLVVMKVVPTRDFMNFPKWLPLENPFLFLAFVIAILLARGVIQWWHTYFLVLVADAQRHFQRFRLLDWAFASKSVNSAEVLVLYNNGIEGVCSSLSNAQNIAVLLSTSVLIFVYLIKISFLITSCSICILFVLALITKRLDVVIRNSAVRIYAETAEVNRGLISHFKNLLLLQIYGTQGKEKDKIKSRLDRIFFDGLRYHKILFVKGVLPSTLGKILICALVVVSTQKTWLPPGLMITYFYLFLQFVQNFSEVVKLITGISFNLPAASAYAKWWADHSYDGVRNRKAALKTETQIPFLEPVSWDMRNISFSYPGNEKLVLKDFNLSIPAKSCVVLVGESGSGKSTILALALGLLDPVKGEILLESQEFGLKKIADIQTHLLASIGYVGPESFLIEGSIYENLVYGLNHVPSQAEVDQALRVADCGFIESFPAKLGHTITEQGQGLSAGQKQRLSFARAILRKPKILILDEATSNLDRETEEKFVHTLGALKGSVTILAVTHREALLSIADQVIKLKSI